MILDYLISKYLDGDLSAEEDAQLRDLVASDPLSRAAFEEAALLHVAMATDEAPEVPDDVDVATYRRMAELITNSQVSAVPRSHPTCRKRMWQPLHGLVAVLFLAASLPFGDLASTWSEDLEDVPAQSHSATIEDSIHNEATFGNVRQAKNYSAWTAATNEQTLEVTAHIDMQIPAVDCDNDVVLNATNLAASDHHRLPVLDSRFTSEVEKNHLAVNDAPSHHNVAMLSTMLGAVGSHGIVSSNEHGLYALSSRMTTSYAVGIMNSTAGIRRVEQIAVGIGFEVAEATWLGFEVGSMRYDVVSVLRGVSGQNEETTGNADATSFGLTPATMPTPVRESKVATHGRSKGLAVTEFERRLRLQSMFGTVRLQRDVVAVGNATLSASIGGGLSETGAMGYGRCGLRYDVFAGTNVFAGAQMQWINAADPIPQGMNRAHSITQIVSFVFGIGVSL
jgi:hypothetical protein